MKKYTVSEVEEILNSIDGIQPAEAPLYTYSKIRNRLEARNTMATGFQIKPILVIGMLLCCIIINIWILSQQKHIVNKDNSNSSIADFSAEYGLNDSYTN
jgi:divalent metal cation (Fe/Co/Zn/Cd) transporter